MKSIEIIIAALLSVFVTTGSSFAQEKLDKMPEPVGGMSVLGKNVHYPEEAKKAGIEGTVYVCATVDAKGNVAEAKITKSDNSKLDKAAVKAVKATKFTPAEKNGKKVKCEVTIPIKFKLGDGEKVKVDKLPEPIDGMASIMKNVHYPEVAKKAGIEGKVYVNALIGKSGEVVSAKVLKSDNDLLSSAALEAVKATKFVPAEKGNEKVECEVTIPIQFKLDGKK
jgi:TonB family protein